MRLIIVAALCALAAHAAPAAAQQKVEKIKARGANAAGACAGSLDMLGQYMTRDPNVNVQRLAEVQQARDFFSEMPRFPQSDIAAAANAFVTLMSNRIRNAENAEQRQAVQREIVTVSSGCFASAKAELRAFQRASPGTLPPTGGTTVQPVPTQPYTAQPAPAQPYTVQPSIEPAPPAQPFTLTPGTQTQ